MKSANPKAEIVVSALQRNLPHVKLSIRIRNREHLASWEVITALPQGCCHTVIEGGEAPPHIAFRQACAYAEREGIRYLCIIDQRRT